MDALLFCSTLNKGGAERQLVLLGAGLAKKGFDVEVYTLTPQFNQEYVGILGSSNIRYGSLIKRKNIFTIFKIIYFLYMKTRKNKKIVVFSFLESSNLIMLFIKLFNRNINLLVGIRDSGQDPRSLNLSNRIVLYLHKRMSFLANYIVSNSYAGEGYLIRSGYNPKKIRVVSNGFDSEHNRIIDPQNKLNLKCQKHTFIIGAVGRITYEKGFENLINAVKRLRNIGMNVGLSIVGKVSRQDYFNFLLDLIKEQRLDDIVKFLPETDNIVVFYNSIDLFVSSSYKEGFSNVIAEAMLCGCPVIATNAGDSARIINNDDFIVSVGDIDGLVQKVINIYNLSEKDRINLGLKARESVISRFSIETMVNSYISLMKANV